MADLPIDDSASVLEEGRHGYAAGIDTSGDFMHLPKAERTAAKERRRKWRAKLRRAEEIRATWGPKQFAEEEARIAAQIEEWERSRDAA